mgnify:CR=1 FL=1
MSEPNKIIPLNDVSQLSDVAKAAIEKGGNNFYIAINYQSGNVTGNRPPQVETMQSQPVYYLSDTEIERRKRESQTEQVIIPIFSVFLLTCFLVMLGAVIANASR